MKKLLILIASLLMLPAFSHGTESTDEAKIRIALTQSTGRPTRSVLQTPVECYYVTASNEIELNFSKDLGVAIIRIQNILSGATVQETIMTTIGIFYATIPGTSGCYTVDISCEDGSHFYGDFQAHSPGNNIE